MISSMGLLHRPVVNCWSQDSSRPSLHSTGPTASTYVGPIINLIFGRIPCQKIKIILYMPKYYLFSFTYKKFFIFFGWKISTFFNKAYN
jgi:hypothetical protein